MSQQFSNEIVGSRLHDEKSFYPAFLHDLNQCKEEVIIESPYIADHRARLLTPVFENLLSRNVRIFVVTRDPKEHNAGMEFQSEEAIRLFETIGVQVFLCTGNHHRKVAILDRSILWEGSLNILSQTYSREIMRRISSKAMSVEMLNFLNLSRYL